MNNMCNIGNRPLRTTRPDVRYESQQMIVVSTGHVSQNTSEIFTEQSASAKRPIPSMIWEYGWMVYIGSGVDNIERTLPKDLTRCILWAKTHYPFAQWLRFDRDAGRMSDLPWFER